jgi:SAM-dependent MidA family methyltransferase
METVLYHPTLGYYEANKTPMGQGGDFITAPELSPLFADCLASECSAVLTRLGVFDVIEFGAGSGQLAIDLMRAFKEQGQEIHRYIIIELSATLRARQAEHIKEALAEDSDKICWMDAPPAGFLGVVIANEVLDALPCHTFSIQNGQFSERGVVFKDDHFSFADTPIFSPLLHEALIELQETVDFPTDYSSEINLVVYPFLKKMTAVLQKAVIFLIDYGYGRKEYYHPARRLGTLSCFYQHCYHSDPFKMPGLQDITAHVDFTRVAECALQLGLSVNGYTSQASFLLGRGLLDYAAKRAKSLSDIEQFQLHQAIKRLTFPMEMGETIKVMALAKGCDAREVPLSGFRLKDRRGDL